MSSTPASPVDRPNPLALALHLRPCDGRPARTVVVEGDAGTRWEQVRPHLPAPWDQVPAFVGETPVHDGMTLGAEPLLHTATLTDRPAPRPPRALLELAVAEGPDAGRLVPLRVGADLGRDPEGGIPLADREVSRRHARLEVDQGRVRVHDLGSTNGTTVDGAPVGPDAPVELTVGQRLRVGGSVLRLTAPGAERPAPVRDGRRVIHPPPRTVPTLATAELERPAAPEDERGATPWLTALLPIPVAVVLAVVLRSPMMLALALAGPVMLLAQAAHDRRQGRESRRRRLAQVRERTAQLERTVEELTRRELADRRRLAPDLAEVLVAASTGRAWPRRPGDADHLLVRLGTGRVRSGVRVREPDRSTHHLELEHAPVAVGLDEHRVVGISGPPAPREAMVRSLLGQLAALHSPAGLRLVVVSDRPAEHAWTRWLPHVRPAAAADPAVVHTADTSALRALLEPLAAEPEQGLGRTRPGVGTVVLLDTGETASVPVLADLVRHGPENGAAVVAVAPAHEGLPSACTATVRLDDALTGVLTAEGEQPFAPDLPSAGWHLRVAAAVGGLVDADPAGDTGRLPDRVRFTDLAAGDLAGPVTVERVTGRWAARPRSTRALLGRDAEGVVAVDLAQDGPHALVAGTTGAGKSELLQTLIAGLALANRPDELCFLLVDYKGGAAFRECARLPHTVGLVTDLDPHLTRRALTSLEAEVRRRERMLHAAGASDLAGYQAAAGTGLPPMPRLVLVIDEFRVLAEELPDFIDGLVRIAAVGRSLGIHLVLATQRPAGVVSADIRANVNLRIALRVRDVTDSQDVIDSPEAAAISPRTPGRAVLRAAGGPGRTVQVARVGGPAGGGDGPVGVRVREVDPATGILPPAGGGADDDGPSDLGCLVEVLTGAADRAQVPRLSSPWLPALPTQVLLDDLGPAQRLLGEEAPADPDAVDVTGAGAPAGPTARLGLLDLPAQQARAVAGWHLPSGHLAVVGGPRSGRSTLARAVVADLAASHHPDDLHLYVLDLGGALAAVERLPHCGARVDDSDPARAGRLLEWLGEEVRRRQVLLAGRHHADLTELRAAAGEGERPAHLLVVVDGWDAFADGLGVADGGALLDTMHQVLRDGAGAGVHVLLTGGRGVLTGRVGTSVPHRLGLRPADETDLVLAGLRPAQVPDRLPPGRALTLPEGAELQVPLLDTDPSGAHQAAAVERIAAACPQPRTCPPRRFADLPERLTWDDLPQPVDGVVIGLGGPEAQPVTVPEDPTTGPSLLVAGPPRSGRTTTLLALAGQLAARGPVHWLPGTGTAPALPPWAQRAEEDPDRLWARLDEVDFSTLVVDDVDLLADEVLAQLVASYLEICRRGRGALLVSGSPEELMTLHRGAVAELRRRRTGLLLRPGRRDGDLLGTAVPVPGRSCPGRGVLVDRGRAVDVQVALPR